MFQEGIKVAPYPSKGFQDAGQNSFALGGRVPIFLIIFPDFRSTAKMEKGTISIPLGQRISDGSINKKFFSCWSQGKYVHDCIFRILELEWVSIIVIIDRGGLRYLCELREGTSLCARRSASLTIW